ncbi:Peptidase M16 inactive domain protein [anaerobic digester metagenome]
MKNLKTILSVTLCGLLSLAGMAQPQMTWESPVPVDPKVVIGKLDNGMTYYIRANAEPKSRADFYIVHNVGAILEEDDQNGLAHFTEHMAFNGTKNYPGKGVLNFLEKIGVKFGHNVNAFTGTDVTAYNLTNVPLTRETIIDSALLILNDWSSYIAFEDAEVDAERGVIREEWRTRRTADFRIRSEKSQYLYKGSKYAKRDVIGDLDIINTFKYETIKRFYNDWYRPDLQAIIIVGDFDPAMMEAKVKERFNQIPARENRQPRPDFGIPDNEEMIVGVVTDPEATRTMVEVYYKQPAVAFDQKNMGYYRDQIVNSLYTQMINARLNELVQKENPPFVFGYSVYTGLVRTVDSYLLMANARENESERALRTLLEENYRLKQHGFTQTELDRAKADLLRSYEKNYNERDKQKHEDFVWQYFSHFTSNEPIPGAEYDFMLAQALMQQVNLDAVNALVNKYITQNNMVVIITGPEKEKATMPTEEKIKALVAEISSSSLEAYVDNVSTEPLIATMPTPGKVAKEVNNQEIGVTEWTLSNGVKVIVKPTDFKEDEVRFSAYSPGGSSLVADADVMSANMMSSIVAMSGVGNFSSIELEKMLAGKMVSVNPYLGESEEGFNGNCSPKDIEIMLQMVNLYFTQPRFDEGAFNAYMSRIQAVLQNAGANPNMMFRDSVSVISSGRNVRRAPLNAATLSQVKLDRIKAIYLDRFSNAGDFTFVFVGNVNANELKPMVETYLGSLPNTKRKEAYKDNNIRFPKGNTKAPFAVAMQTPKTSIFVSYEGKAAYSLQNKLMMQTIDHVLDLRYTEEIREKQGGTYGVQTMYSLGRTPYEGYNLSMVFDTDPAMADKLIEIVHSELLKLTKEGPSQDDLDKAREYFLKSRQENMRENRFWVSVITDYYKNNVNVLKDYEKLVKELTPAAVQKEAAKILKGANVLEVIMRPAE